MLNTNLNIFFLLSPGHNFVLENYTQNQFSRAELIWALRNMLPHTLKITMLIAYNFWENANECL